MVIYLLTYLLIISPGKITSGRTTRFRGKTKSNDSQALTYAFKIQQLEVANVVQS